MSYTTGLGDVTAFGLTALAGCLLGLLTGATTSPAQSPDTPPLVAEPTAPPPLVPPTEVVKEGRDSLSAPSLPAPDDDVVDQPQLPSVGGTGLPQLDARSETPGGRVALPDEDSFPVLRPTLSPGDGSEPFGKSANSDGDSREERDRQIFELFEGPDFLKHFDDVPDQLTIRVRRVNEFHQPGGKGKEPHRQVVYETMTVSTKGNDHTPEQRLGILVAIQERELHDTSVKLMKESDESVRAGLLKELRTDYSIRFQIDTMYQDYQVRKIERRAEKLRSEVQAREKAIDEWVDAMVTLAKVRASGIETMPGTLQPARSPTPAAGYAPFVPSPAGTPLGASTYSGTAFGMGLPPNSSEGNGFATPTDRGAFKPLPTPRQDNASSFRSQ